MQGAFFAAEKETAARFARFREQYLEKRGADCGTWQPVASRVAGLEQLLAELADGGSLLVKLQFTPTHFTRRSGKI